MKVFAPKHVVQMGTYAPLPPYHDDYVGLGIPLDGEWIDSPDYFYQVTNGEAINDVIHAKVVTSTGVDYSCANMEWRDSYGTLIRGGTSIRANSIYFYESGVCYQKFGVVDWYMPNYKGKKHQEPRRRHRDVRVTYGYAVSASFNTSYNRPSVSCTLYLLNHLRDDKDKGLYTTWRPNLRVYWSEGRNRRIQVIATPELYPIANEFAEWETATYGEHFPDYSGFTEEMRLRFYGVLHNIIQEHILDLCLYAERQQPSSGTAQAKAYYCGRTWLPEVNNLRQAFILDEPEIYFEHIDVLALGRTTRSNSYWRGYLTHHALVEAIESFPRLSDNMISNALEVLGFIKALAVDHRIEIPKSLSAAWLSYRYQYGTTKADVEDAIAFVSRNINLGGWERDLICRGTSHANINGIEVTCRCECLIIPQIVTTAKRLLRTLDTYGLTVDFYVVWDMVPFSFMVDWFASVGDVLNVEDINSKFMSGEYYKILWTCFSFSYISEADGNRVKCYTRWKGDIPDHLESMYWLEPAGGSQKTTVFRVLDAASIFIGI